MVFVFFKGGLSEKYVYVCIVDTEFFGICIGVKARKSTGVAPERCVKVDCDK